MLSLLNILLDSCRVMLESNSLNTLGSEIKV
jgi:hypothetical protein